MATSPPTLCPSSNRLISADVVRILAMLFICICHACGSGQFIQHQESMVGKAVSLTIAVLAHTGVDLFILISGYCGVYSTHKTERFFKLWLLVVFFNLLYVPLSLKAGYYDNPSHIMLQALPVPLAGGFWFFTAYTGLFILSPYLNDFIKRLPHSVHYTLFASLLFLFCFVNRGNSSTSEIAGTGYNVIWMCALYLVGAILRLSPPAWKNSTLIIAALIGLFAQTGTVVLASLLKAHPFSQAIPFQLSYTSPLLVMLAISLFLLLVRMNLQEWRFAKVVLFLSPLMFGVYISHSHLCILEHYITPFLHKFFIVERSADSIGLVVAGLAIFLLGLVASFIQSLVFRLLHADKCAAVLSKIWAHITQKTILCLFRPKE